MPYLKELRFSVSSMMVPAARNWRRTCDSVLCNLGVSAACAMPLLMLWRVGDGIHQVTLARKMSIDSSSTVRLLDQLSAAGLVRQEYDRTDRRAKVVTLTDAGTRVAASIDGALNQLRAEVLEGCSKEELEATLRVLQMFAKSGEAGATDAETMQ
ncbi:MarR family transcriptional regulator, transcriptional regulator for hemolysin [Burkholderia sp. WP9]|uniref:MarR family winged helix-turn-helix transcriptional regulator n=1 Tax=Burkholderia sp. WP9 TaxID=1500263 RepID=UPI00089BD809|nr:MarR family transcriptional regulator [Burkholderia sp. WP9]SEF14125.1 MarR family transcriptional regulator, transcriptional regulator for hemolysin [Burkholderia sp. WP9]